MADWEYLGETNIQKSLTIRKTASRTAGQYGVTKVYDQERPEVTHALKGTGLTSAERTSLVNLAMAVDGTTTVKDNAGDQWSGRIVGFSTQRMDGTDRWEANLTLRPQDDES